MLVRSVSEEVILTGVTICCFSFSFSFSFLIVVAVVAVVGEVAVVVVAAVAVLLLFVSCHDRLVLGLQCHRCCHVQC